MLYGRGTPSFHFVSLVFCGRFGKGWRYLPVPGLTRAVCVYAMSAPDQVQGSDGSPTMLGRTDERIRPVSCPQGPEIHAQKGNLLWTER